MSGGARTCGHFVNAKAPGTPRCTDCTYFFITYDPHFPYGCRAMNIKSRQHPHAEVEAASGMPCQMFSPRPAKAP